MNICISLMKRQNKVKPANNLKLSPTFKKSLTVLGLFLYDKTMSKNVIKAYQNYCTDNGLRASKPRESVLQIIADAHKPQTAYEILDKLGKIIKSPKPPTVYRALESLSEHGFVHRIESLNAYIACHENHRHSGSQFMICDDCGRVEEIHLCSIPEALQKQAATKNFATTHWNVELHGTCKNCA